MKKSLFIVIDGIDGSGKGTMVDMLYDYLFSLGEYRILTTVEPTSGRYGRKVRQILRKEKDPMKGAEKCLRLYVKDREEHLKQVIVPFLRVKNSIVICDRYYYSTIAYQNAQGIELERVIEANRKFRKPDIAFIFDLPAEIALKRVKKVREIEKFEKIEFMEKLRDNFLKLTNYLSDNIRIIDASKGKKEVFNQVKKEVDNLL